MDVEVSFNAETDSCQCNSSPFQDKNHTLLALITPALSQRRPILRRPLFRQEQISTYRHLGPPLTPR